MAKDAEQALGACSLSCGAGLGNSLALGTEAYRVAHSTGLLVPWCGPGLCWALEATGAAGVHEKGRNSTKAPLLVRMMPRSDNIHDFLFVFNPH